MTSSTQINRSSKAGRRLQHYFVAVWTVALAFLVTLLLSSVVTPGMSPIFLVAVIVSAWRGGLGPGLFATALSAFASAFVFLPPAFTLRVDRDDLLQLANFVLVSIVIGTLGAARRKAESDREALLSREKQARIDAERANAVKDEFLAAVSHELRTPLTTIKTLTRLLLRKRPSEEERQEYLADIASECDRQIDLVHNLLDLSRIKAGGMQLKLQQVDIGEVVRACEKIERIEASEHHHEFRIEIAPDLPAALAEHSALRRALCSVIENAIKYTPDGGVVSVRARREDENITIEVEDNGPGISPVDLPHVFKSFYRGQAEAPAAFSNSDKQEVPGIGLGLHLARVLVETMHGSIDVRSGVSSGSVFTIRLPVFNDHERLKELRSADAVAEMAVN